MPKTRLVVIPQSKRVSAEDLWAIAACAVQLSKIIRDWLPVAGDSTAKVSNARTAAEWFSHAAKLYEDGELIRNPEYVPFNGNGLTNHGGSDARQKLFKSRTLPAGRLLVINRHAKN
jgi:hypothetical protein